jgi:hypothetical protein
MVLNSLEHYTDQIAGALDECACMLMDHVTHIFGV